MVKVPQEIVGKLSDKLLGILEAARTLDSELKFKKNQGKITVTMDNTVTTADLYRIRRMDCTVTLRRQDGLAA